MDTTHTTETTMMMTTQTVRWDDSSDPSNPGWVVMTETVGWQPIGGSLGLARDTDPAVLNQAAACTLFWHDSPDQ
jgi:hypothetical protein